MFDPLAPWTLVATHELPKIPFMGRLVEDEVILPNGVSARWTRYADERDGQTVLPAVMVICRRKDGYLLVFDHWSHGCQQIITEFPAGGVEAGEEIEDAAVRECREEVGVRPQKLTPLGQFPTSPRKGGFVSHVFLGEDCIPDPLPCDEAEILVPQWISPEELNERILDGRFVNLYNLAAWTLLSVRGL